MKHGRRFLAVTIAIGILTVAAAIACLFYPDINRYVARTYDTRPLIPYYLAAFPILKMGLAYLLLAAILWNAPLWLQRGTRRMILLAVVLFLCIYAVFSILWISGSIAGERSELDVIIQLFIAAKGEWFYPIGVLLCLGVKDA